ISQSQLRKLVPIYEEGAVDDDLLNEGRRNLQNHLQALGYFGATVSVSQRGVLDGKNLRVLYAITPGDRHKLAVIRISGNQFFEAELVRGTMLCQPGGRVISHGRYSEALLEEDVRTIQDMYRSNGFRQAKVAGKLLEKYQGDPSQLAIQIDITEGAQTRVAPVSQQDMLESQRKLYNLGLFTEVNTAIQNPDGNESRKNVLVAMRETKRYTFDYGIGFEFQTGQPSFGTNQPLGQTGASPRVSF